MVSNLKILQCIRKLWTGQENLDGRTEARTEARTDNKQRLSRLCRAHRKRAQQKGHINLLI